MWVCVVVIFAILLFGHGELAVKNVIGFSLFNVLMIATILIMQSAHKKQQSYRHAIDKANEQISYYQAQTAKFAALRAARKDGV